MEIQKIFLLFIFYSIIGWAMEVTQYYIRNKKFVNRGFLIGPYCPIYGYGAVAITLLLRKYLNDPIVLYFMAIIICSILEYSTSFLMEKMFKTRWWDYSKKRFNINGRICLETMIPFGILGVIISYFVNPVLFNLINKIPSEVLNIVSFIVFILFVIDNAVSFTIISNLKEIGNGIRGDSTERVTKEVRKVIARRQQKLYNRIVKAFPTFVVVRKK